ncbi:hypothetical protein DSL92_01660 [Billgrantia gudaonensis]|uniref:Uncharacterized protein n=1 Tax=Billgrantia gudaonensis TaxID=376427 RepID=A0A432JK95_9GAMM|nr:hypothetical protein DSL92_01660 [Halomonas gudaonensis]
MLIVPLISLVAGISSLKDLATLCSGWEQKRLLWYLALTAWRFIGLALSIIFKPGVGVDISAATDSNVNADASELHHYRHRSVCLTNPIEAFATGTCCSRLSSLRSCSVSIVPAGDAPQ